MAYSTLNHHILAHKFAIVRAVGCFLACLFLHYTSIAGKINMVQSDEEITVTLVLNGLGSIEVPAIYHDKELYLSVTGVFDFLRIRNIPSASFDSISGFFMNEQDRFLIDNAHNRILYQGKVINILAGDLVSTETGLFLKISYFSSVFGLVGVFDFHRLQVTMTSAIELPIIREMREEFLRQNINNLKGEIKVDTNLKRNSPFFQIGVADWSAISTQYSAGKSDSRLNLGLGAIVAGGEANVSLNYYSNLALSEKQQYYQWRHVDNDNDFVRQLVIGKIFPQSTATLYAPLIGVQFTNASTVHRRAYGVYTLSNTTEPGWIAELYINDVMIDHKKTDATGFYSFEVPLVYGYSFVELRFYGPYGEQRSSQQYFTVPFNFLPAGETEYLATAGILEDSHNSQFSRVSVNHGISNHFTIGCGDEYLSSIASGNTNMPFVSSSIRFAARLLWSGEYTYGVRLRNVVSYRLPSNVQFDLDFTKYTVGQTAIYYNYLEEHKLVVSVPFHSFGTSILSKLTMDQVIMPTTKFLNTELAFAGSIRRIGINLVTYASFARVYNPYIYSNLSLSCLFHRTYLASAQLQYDDKVNRVDYMKYSIEDHILNRGYVNISFQEYFHSSNTNVLIGVRYDLSFARVAASTLATRNYHSFIESASGSLVYDNKEKYFNANNRANIGRGGILVTPYFDLNNNGIRDLGEPEAEGLRLHINGGRTVYNGDTSIHIFDLEPYVNYYIQLDQSNFDNIAWQIKNHALKVSVNPNILTVVEVPVVIVGEVSGTVFLKRGDSNRGQGQILVGIYNSDSALVTSMMTDQEGFFSYLGLLPGNYTVRVDQAQLNKLNIRATPMSFTIKPQHNKDGDVVDGLEIVLLSSIKTADAVNKVDTAVAVAPDLQKTDPIKSKFTIQVACFYDEAVALAQLEEITALLKCPMAIVQKGNFYKVRVVGFQQKKDAVLFLPKLSKAGFYTPLVVQSVNRAR